jgi:hypothetical protein
VAYSDILSRQIEDYARELEPLWAMRELYKIISVARYLKPSGVSASATMDASWTPPRRVEATWNVASVGTGRAWLGRVALTGGVYCPVKGATKISRLPEQRAQPILNAAASAQLDAVKKSLGSGICYDGQPGCGVGVPLGAIRIGNSPRGSASLPPDTVAKMRSWPDLARLLDGEDHAIADWVETQNIIREKQASLAAASPAEKGQHQVELANAIQKSAEAQSKFNTAPVKVEEGAKMVVEHR